MTPSPSATSLNGNSNERRTSSADQVSIKSSSSSQPGVIYKLAREQTKANSLKRNAHLAALRRGDGRIEDLEKDKENDVNVRPIVNNLSQNLSATKSRLTPSPIPIEFGNKDIKEESNQSMGFQHKSALRVSQKDTQSLLHNKEIKSTNLLSDGEYNVQASQLPDNTPDLREMHAQMVKGNLISQSYFSQRAMNIFNHQNNPLLLEKMTTLDILQDSIARDKEMVSRIKRLRLKNPRKKSTSNSQIFPLGAQLPVNTVGESVKLPKVSHRKVQNHINPTLRYTKAAKAVDRMKKINDEIERLHKVTAVSASLE